MKTKHTTQYRRSQKAKPQTQRRPAARGGCARPSRYWLDIGKNISLALMAQKYDLDIADDAGKDGAQ